LRNGLIIAGVTGNTQTGIIGLLLILSVLLPNLAERLQERLRRQVDPSMRAPPDRLTEPARSPAAPG
jgi:rhamnose transport system permease protein